MLEMLKILDKTRPTRKNFSTHYENMECFLLHKSIICKDLCNETIKESNGVLKTLSLL